MRRSRQLYARVWIVVGGVLASTSSAHKLGDKTSSKGNAYNPVDAAAYGLISSVTYCEKTLESVLNWTCPYCLLSGVALVPGKVRIIDGGVHNASRTIIGKLQEQPGCVIAFRGSDNVWNFLSDIEFWRDGSLPFSNCTNCAVHSGYAAIWKNIRDTLDQALLDVGCTNETNSTDNKLYVTGHSLGAGLAALAMFHFGERNYEIAAAYTFESPRVGNHEMATAFNDRFQSQIPSFRVTYNMDPIPHLPPVFAGYEHVQKEVFYNEQGLHTVCEQIEDPSCSNQFWDIPKLLLLHKHDHCHIPLVPNHDICCPVGCCFEQCPGDPPPGDEWDKWFMAVRRGEHGADSAVVDPGTAAAAAAAAGESVLV